jgi:hypothetical protein
MPPPKTHAVRKRRPGIQRVDDKNNSALFAPDLADQAVLSDDILAGLAKKLYEARYRSTSADIMANTHKQYLGKTLVQLADARDCTRCGYTELDLFGVWYLVDLAAGDHY